MQYDWAIVERFVSPTLLNRTHEEYPLAVLVLVKECAQAMASLL